MNPRVRTWLPAALLAVGVILVKGINAQAAFALLRPLASVIPTEMEGLVGEDFELSDAERIAAGVDDYLLRNYRRGDSVAVNLYVGYYERQTQGRTIHSPRNCMPGSGWDALASRYETFTTDAGDEVTVNRYVLQRESEQVLVLYWYQGRGRVASNEYLVKWQLLRDAALQSRTEEALVRLVVPFDGDEEGAFQLARRMAEQIIPALDQSLPQ